MNIQSQIERVSNPIIRKFERNYSYPERYRQNGWDKELDEAYAEFRATTPYLRGECDTAVGIIAGRMAKFGFSTDRGSFKLDFPMWLTNLEDHNWALDDQNNIVDMTAPQFNPGLLPWHWVPKGVLVIPRISKLGLRYLYHQRPEP